MTATRINGVPANRGGLSRLGAYWLGRYLPERPPSVSPEWWRDFVRHVVDGVPLRALCDERGMSYPTLRWELDQIHRAAISAGSVPEPRATPPPQAGEGR